MIAVFFHGIDFKYVIQQYPILSPRRTVSEKNKEQLADRRHLIQQLGFEPVHLLESSGPSYPRIRCIKECLAFGDTVFAFRHLPLPYWQLSLHEIGVPVLDLRKCAAIYTTNLSIKEKLISYFPGKPAIIIKK